MTWEYALIGLVVGIIIGTISIRFGNPKLRQQHMFQRELKKSKAELDKYREELTSHFARSAELLDNMANDYRQLYQHMTKNSNNLLPNQHQKDNHLSYRLTEAEADNDQVPAEIQLHDYQKDTSSLRRTMRSLHK